MANELSQLLSRGIEGTGKSMNRSHYFRVSDTIAITVIYVASIFVASSVLLFQVIIHRGRGCKCRSSMRPEILNAVTGLVLSRAGLKFDPT